jgi:hypothetical protein
MQNQRSILAERLSELVNAYDLQGIVLLSQQAPQGDAAAWRKEMMKEGFMSLYSYLSCDQMCGKLGEGGLDFLEEVVEETEKFCGSPLHTLRAEVLSFRLDGLKETDSAQAQVFAEQAIEELSKNIAFDTSVLAFRAHLHHEIAQLNPAQALLHWQRAIDDLIAGNSFDLRILYPLWPKPIEGMEALQAQEQSRFRERIGHALATHPDRLWQLLDEAARLTEYQKNPALEARMADWLSLALAWKGNSAQPERLRSAGLLLQKQGKIRQEAAYLAKAIECFELFIAKTQAHAMEVNYLANAWEERAALCPAQSPEEMDCLQKAWDSYLQHEEIVCINFSPLLHYAEFLERLYYKEYLKKRPSEAKILALAKEAEVMGEGYYSGPGMIQARMAIYENDAESAVYHLCRLLLRHELCIDTLIKELRQSLKDTAPSEVVAFLDEVLTFMDKASEGYYYDPAFSVIQLNALSPAETLQAWQARMVEIQSRSPLA